jgi:hypothetical protein
MPAIDLARLKKQTARLVESFDQPEVFLRELREVLEFYVNHTLRHRDIAPASTLQTYRTPAPVLRHIENSLAPLARKNPQTALILADALWDEGYLETRLLAAFLLGQIPPREDRLLARLTAWTQQVRDPNVRASLLTQSLIRLRKETPERFLSLVKEWIHPAREQLWANSIQALLPLVKDPEYENLPPVFSLLETILLQTPVRLQEEIKTILLALYEVSPVETIHFLKSTLETARNPKLDLLIRRISSDFPASLRESLLPLLRRGTGRLKETP